MGDVILDVGCGGGRTVHKLAQIATSGKVYGIDHSQESVAASRRMNRNSVESGLVEIRHGSVSNLPFPPDMFDLVTAVETHFFWPDLPADMREVLRVLKPGGTFVIIAETYKGGKLDKLLEQHGKSVKFIDLAGSMKLARLSVDDHHNLFCNAGYSKVHIFEEYDKGWICGLGTKPSDH